MDQLIRMIVAAVYARQNLILLRADGCNGKVRIGRFGYFTNKRGTVSKLLDGRIAS